MKFFRSVLRFPSLYHYYFFGFLFISALAAGIYVFSHADAHSFLNVSLFEPADGKAYFGFTFRNWESSDPAYGDTRLFAERYTDAIQVELGGKDPSLFGVPTIWQKADGTMQPFSTTLNIINQYASINGGNSVPLISWNAQTGWDVSSSTYNGITTQTIEQGTLDGYIRQYARDVKAYGNPLFIRLICGEVNGTWWHNCSPGANPSLTKADFIGAWRHVIDIFRQEGVTNVAWVWNLNTFPAFPANWGIDTDIASYYPGDEYVDWVGADHYDYGSLSSSNTNPMTPATYLDPHYAFAVNHSKPFFLAEWGVKHSGSNLTATQQQDWINAMFDYIESHPGIKAVLYFNYNMNTPSVEDAAHMASHIWLYNNTVNYHPGTATQDHRLIAENGASLRATFASRIAASRYTSTVSQNNAHFMSQTVPSTMVGGQQYTVSISMENTGTGSNWNMASSYRLGSLNPQSNAIWGTDHADLAAGETIAVGQQKTFSFTVTAPITPGTYTFQWAMFQQNDRPFGEPSSALSVTVTAPADTQPPVTTITSPANGATVSGNVNVQATAIDNTSVSKVEFFIDNALVATDISAPYSTTWNSQAYAHGSSHTMVAKATDMVGNVGTSSTVTVTVADVTPPATSVTSPASGATVPKNADVTITANASDISGISKVEFSVNGTLKCTDVTAPYSCVWRVPAPKNALYSVQANAYDRAGNIGMAAIQVTSK